MTSKIFYSFSAEKNKLLKEIRGLSFDDVIHYINDGKVIDIIVHPNQKKYNGQEMYIIDIENYIYIVPFLKEKNNIFLKTIFPSRKATKFYLKGA